MSLHLWEWLLDAAALLAFIIAAAGVWQEGVWWAGMILVAAAIAVLARRAFPVWSAMLGVVVSGATLFSPFVAVSIWVLAEVVLFSLAIRAPRAWTFALASVHAALLYFGAIVVFGERPWEPVALILPVWTAAVVAIGLALRSNADYVRALESQARSALAFRESEVARHLGKERLRIARDLHDSVAHSVSVISLHAGSAERQLERDPRRARESLAQVRISSREVVDELQDILALLRDPQASAEPDEVPGTAAIASLVSTARNAGLLVTETLDALPDVDRPVGVAIYRILQESFTNALKHGAGDLSVTMRTEGSTVLIVVSNELSGRGSARGGFGIVGMTERAASVHGTLETRAAGGRFILRARLPVRLHTHESEGL